MIHKNDTGEISTILGVPQNPPLKFDYEWDEFETVAEMDAAGKRPNDADILALVNGNAERSALSGARAKRSATEIARIQDTREYKVRKLASDIQTASNGAKSEAEATAIAESLVAR